jgi:hypothetical protein
MRRGDHIRVSRGVYSHHGVYAGDGIVIHYSGREAGSATIRRDALEVFAQGGTVEVIKYASCFRVNEVIRRAESRIGENGYSLFGNNCEHFARWCKTGEHTSEQVRDAAAGGAMVGGVPATAAGALGVVSATGAAAGLSGAGIMSGLAAVGGTAIGGVAVLASAPAAITCVAMTKVLGDNKHLPEPERDARRAGRYATVAGAAVGTAGSVAAISAAGTVAGLSGAGITSGLAAIGGTVGGGMAAGTAIAVAAPATIAVGIGYGVYRLWRWLTH